MQMSLVEMEIEQAAKELRSLAEALASDAAMLLRDVERFEAAGREGRVSSMAPSSALGRARRVVEAYEAINAKAEQRVNLRWLARQHEEDLLGFGIMRCPKHGLAKFVHEHDEDGEEQAGTPTMRRLLEDCGCMFGQRADGVWVWIDEDDADHAWCDDRGLVPCEQGEAWASYSMGCGCAPCMEAQHMAMDEADDRTMRHAL